MRKNLSITERLFGERSPGTTVKRRIRNIHWPILQRILEAKRSGTPPQQPPPARFRYILTFLEKVWQRITVGSGYYVSQELTIVIVSDKAKLGALTTGNGSNESSLVTLILVPEKARQTTALGSSALLGAGSQDAAEAEAVISGITFSSGEYFLPKFSEGSSVAVAFDSCGYVLAIFPSDNQIENMATSVAFFDCAYVEAIHNILITESVSTSGVVSAISSGISIAIPTLTENVTCSGQITTIDSFTVQSTPPLTENEGVSGSFTGGTYS